MLCLGHHNAEMRAHPGLYEFATLNVDNAHQHSEQNYIISGVDQISRNRCNGMDKY